MALHLNLYHELQKQHRARKRDPLKLSMYGIALVVLGFVAYYFVRVAQVSDINTRLSGVETEWQGLEPKQKTAATEEAALTAQVKLSEALVQRIEDRLFWAPILQKIMETVPSEVQLTRLEGSHVGERSKQVNFNVTGIASGAEPRQTAEDLRTRFEQKLGSDTLKVSSLFRVLEDGEDTVKLGDKTLQTATFSIQLGLAMKDPAPTVTAKNDRKKR